MVIRDGYCTREIKMSVDISKEEFKKKYHSLQACSTLTQERERERERDHALDDLVAVPVSANLDRS